MTPSVLAWPVAGALVACGGGAEPASSSETEHTQRADGGERDGKVDAVGRPDAANARTDASTRSPSPDGTAQSSPATALLDAGPPPPMLGDRQGEEGTPESTAVLERDAGPSSAAPVEAGGREVVVDKNVGKGSELALVEADRGDGTGAVCATFVQSFGHEPARAAEFAKIPAGLDMTLYSLYRPAVLEAKRKYPLLVWGNGTCAVPESYGPVLRQVAAEGFFIIAANSRWVRMNDAMKKSLDWALAANNDPNGPYYDRIDVEKIGAFGHGQGALATSDLAADPRVRATLLFNGSFAATKPTLFVTGDRGGDPLATLASVREKVSAASQAAFLWYHKIPETGGAIDVNGQLLVLLQPERVAPAAAAWFRFTLQQDPAARAWFVGPDCQLCGQAVDFDFGQHGLAPQSVSMKASSLR